MLTNKEYVYFNNMQNLIKHRLNVNVTILAANHSKMFENGSNILGCCHKITDSNGNLVSVFITIDENHIRECFYLYKDLFLAETICHEIAHLFIWNHGKEHDLLTRDFMYLAGFL